jgi:hypothetical protein
MRNRLKWFESPSEAYMALWWIPEGQIPSVDEAKDRLELLRLKGPTAEAFTFRDPFDAPG